MIQIEGLLGSIIFVVAMYLLISAIWSGAEVLLYGKTTPRFIDDIVAIILSISLLFNIK